MARAAELTARALLRVKLTGSPALATQAQASPAVAARTQRQVRTGGARNGTHAPSARVSCLCALCVYAAPRAGGANSALATAAVLAPTRRAVASAPGQRAGGGRATSKTGPRLFLTSCGAQLDGDKAKVEKELSNVVPPEALTAHGVYLLKKGILVIKADMRAQGCGATNKAAVYEYIESLFALCPEKRDKYEARAEANRKELADPTKAELLKDQEEKLLAKVREGAARVALRIARACSRRANAECASHSTLAQSAAAAAGESPHGAGCARQQSVAAGLQKGGARMTKPKPYGGDKSLAAAHKTAELVAPQAAQAPQAPPARAPAAAPVAQPAPARPNAIASLPGGVRVLFPPPPGGVKRTAPDAAAASGTSKKQQTGAQAQAARVEPAAASPPVAAPREDALPAPSALAAALAPAAAAAHATQESAGSDPHRSQDAPTLPALGAASAAGSQQVTPATSNVAACATARAAAVQAYADATRTLDSKKAVGADADAAAAAAAEAARVAVAAAAAARERAAAAARDIVAAEADVAQRRTAMHASLEAEAMAVAAANSAAL